MGSIFKKHKLRILYLAQLTFKQKRQAKLLIFKKYNSSVILEGFNNDYILSIVSYQYLPGDDEH